MQRIILRICLLLGPAVPLSGQGLEGLFVDKIPVSAEAISSDNRLTGETYLYRVFVDLNPGYRLNSVLGTPSNPLIIKTSTSFFNAPGASVSPSYTQAPSSDQPLYYDSWLAAGYSPAGILVPLEEDSQGEQDGYIAPGDGSLLPELDPLTGFSFYFGEDPGGAADGSGEGWDPENVIWYIPGGVTGYGTENRVCIGQFTTDGEFYIEIGVDLGTGNAGEASEHWVAREALFDNQQVSSNLVYRDAGRLLTFTSPLPGETLLLDTYVTLKVLANDPDENVTGVSFHYIGSGSDHNPIIELLTPPYIHSWKVTDPGITSLYAVALLTDGDRDTSRISVQVNAPPEVILTYPEDQVPFRERDLVPFVAQASDPDGSVDRVEFLVDGIVRHREYEPPYEFIWEAEEGPHLLAAAVVDNLGTRIFTPSVLFQVEAWVNRPPVISITKPQDQEMFMEGDTVVIVAEGSDPDEGDGIDSVLFLVDGTGIGTIDSAPFSTAWISRGTGIRTLTAIAYDRNGGNAISSVVPVRIMGTTGSPGGDASESLHLRPNPVTDVLTLVAPCHPAGPVTGQVVDEAGRIWMEFNLQDCIGERRILTLDVTGLPEGVYQIRSLLAGKGEVSAWPSVRFLVVR